MKKQTYEKMKSMFHLIQHDWQDIGPLELIIYQLARGNTFNMRVIGLEELKRFRKDNPDCSITFKPNHLSEADFILLSLLFRENDMKVPVEGGSNLFIEDVDIFRNLLPKFINEKFQSFTKNHRMSVAQFLTTRGAFKLFREPMTIKQKDGTEINVGRKAIISLTQAYRHHLVQEKEMYVTFPGYSSLKVGFLEKLKKDGTKTGRSYTGKIDGYHHLPFQMDIEASLSTGVDIYIVDVNIAYERVLEDEHFIELTRLYQDGASKRDIYIKDMGHIMKEFYKDEINSNLSIKFGEPRKIETKDLKGSFVSRKIKSAAHEYAEDSFNNMLSMQPIFSPNIYFTAFNEDFRSQPVQKTREKINDIRNYLRTLVWGKDKKQVDLHYIMGYNNQIISADEIINRTFRIFNLPNRSITDIEGNMFVIHNKEVAKQYRNHTSHFFENFDNL